MMLHSGVFVKNPAVSPGSAAFCRVLNGCIEQQNTRNQLQLCRLLRKFALQRSAVHIQYLGRNRDVIVVFHEDTVNVFPLQPFH